MNKVDSSDSSRIICDSMAKFMPSSLKTILPGRWLIAPMYFQPERDFETCLSERNMRTGPEERVHVESPPDIRSHIGLEAGQ